MSREATVVALITALFSVLVFGLIYWNILHDNNKRISKELRAIRKSYAPSVDTTPIAKYKSQIAPASIPRPEINVKEVESQFTKFFSYSNCRVIVPKDRLLASTSFASRLLTFQSTCHAAHMTFMYKHGHFLTLKIDELDTKGGVLIASQGKEKFTMVPMMGDEVIVEKISAQYGGIAPGSFEKTIAVMVGEEFDKQRRTT